MRSKVSIVAAFLGMAALVAYLINVGLDFMVKFERARARPVAAVTFAEDYSTCTVGVGDRWPTDGRTMPCEAVAVYLRDTLQLHEGAGVRILHLGRYNPQTEDAMTDQLSRNGFLIAPEVSRITEPAGAAIGPDP